MLWEQTEFVKSWYIIYEILNSELRCSDEDTSQKFVNIISVGSKNEVEEIDCGLEIKESCRKSSRIEE